MNQLKQRGIKALLWDMLGKLLTQGMGFIITLLLARMLLPGDFGLIAMVAVIIGIAGVFTDAGLGSALIQRADVNEQHYTSVFVFNVLMGMLLTVLTYLAAGTISGFYELPALEPVAQVMSVAFLLNSLGTVQAAKLRKGLKYSVLAKAGVLSSLLSGAAGVALALGGAGVYALALQSLLASALFSALLWLRSDWRPSPGFSLKALQELWGFGFRMFLANLLHTVTERLDILVIGKLVPAGTLGSYHIAKKVTGLVSHYSSGSLMSVLFPVLSTIQDEKERFVNVVGNILTTLSAVVFLAVGALYILAEPLITILLTDKWIEAADFASLLLLSSFGFPLNALLVNVLRSKGNSRAFLRMAIIKRVTLFSIIPLVFKWGIEGYLIGRIFASIVNTGITVHFAAREMGIKRTVLARPILTQGSIFVVSLALVSVISQLYLANYGFHYIFSLLVFLLAFTGVNAVLQTESWVSGRAHLVSAFKALFAER